VAEEAAMSKPMGITVAKPIPTEGVKAPAPGREMEAFLKKAEKGDKSCLPQVHAYLADPDRGPIAIRHCGSSAEWLRQGIARRASGGNLLVMEAIQRNVDQTRAELEGPDPTPIERLLAERAALCWHIANWYENNFVNSEGMSIGQADYHQRRIDRAHRRFLSAVETLARVRKLAVPVLQVNVAKNQQINTVGSRSDS
jgi:hypothetical protein